MKALKSKLASELLADPAARDQLRRFMVNQHATGPAAHNGAIDQFVVHRREGVLRVEATFVPKAAKTA